MRVTTYHNPPVLTAWRLPGATLLLTAAAVLIFLLPTSTVRLQYDRLAITAGESWRFLSGHWTHFSLDHLVLDVLMFAVLGTLCEAITRARFYLCLFGSAVLIPAAIWLMLPQLETYRGLSGIDSALYVLLVVTLLKHQLAERDTVSMGLAATALLGFIAKVGYEVVTGSTFFLDSSGANMVPIPLAHAVGAVVGLLSGLTPPLTQSADNTREGGSCGLAGRDPLRNLVKGVGIFESQRPAKASRKEVEPDQPDT